MFFKNNSNNDVLQNLDQIEKYLNNEINYITITPSKKSSQISQKIANICELINKKNDEELQIFGEIMLISEKLANGITNDRINFTNSSNFKLNYIAKTINNLANDLENIIKLIKETLLMYGNYNYLSKLDESLVENELKRLSIHPMIGNFKVDNIYSLSISEQTTLFYKINKDLSLIELLLFWNNLRNPDDLIKLL